MPAHHSIPHPASTFTARTKDIAGNNELWDYGTAEVDALILVNQRDLDLENRWAAMHGIDEIVQDEAAYAPFWTILSSALSTGTTSASQNNPCRFGSTTWRSI